MKTGFTLIELLVVVLIISILTAIGLPQYEKAVIKARFANMRTVAAAYKNAEEIYYMANGSYTNDYSKLGLSFPQCPFYDDVLYCDDFFFLDPLTTSTDGKDLSRANLRLLYCPNMHWSRCSKTGYEFIYTVWLNYSSKPNQTECTGRTEKGIAFCKSL